MKIIVTGSLGHISPAAKDILVQKGHAVIINEREVIYHRPVGKRNRVRTRL